jgi:chromosome partitioning protein
MGRIYTIANQKGGVGKTTTTVNLGAYLSIFGQRVLIVDLDPQANASSCLGIDKRAVKNGTYDVIISETPAIKYILYNPKLKLSLLPSSLALAGAEVELVPVIARETRLKNALQPIVERYDYILIDCPPSLGLLTLNGVVAAKDGVIIPVQCEFLALEGVGQLNQTLNRIRSAIFPNLCVRGVILTMFDIRTKLSADVVREINQHFPNEVFKTIVPRSVRLAEAPSYGQPISIYAPGSNGAMAYSNLAREILVGDGVLTPEPVQSLVSAV